MGKNKGDERKVGIGRLSVDPVFLMIFAFFTISALLLVTYILLSLR